MVLNVDEDGQVNCLCDDYDVDKNYNETLALYRIHICDAYTNWSYNDTIDHNSRKKIVSHLTMIHKLKKINLISFNVFLFDIYDTQKLLQNNSIFD